MEFTTKTKSVKVVGFWVSPFVQRVRWALHLKGVEYEYIEEDIYNKTPLLSQLNPVYSKVPVLVHDGSPLPESSIILEYIDETWKNHPLLPLELYERAETRFWAKFVDEKILDNAWIALCSEGKVQENAVRSATEALQMIEDKLKGKKFFGGDDIGYIDLMLGFVSYMLPAWEEISSVVILDPLKFPAIATWRGELLDHALVKSGHLPSKAMMISYFQGRREALMPVFASRDH